MSDPSTPDVGASNEFATYSGETGLTRLQRAPIIDRIDPRQLDLIRRTVAVAEGDQAITNAELGMFLELCAHYDLEWAAREAWIAKSKTGKLLIMVGRAGLRKVADRNGLRVRTDVICAKDEFTSTFVDSPHDAEQGEWEAHGSQPFHRIKHVKHGIGTAARGAVAGAWSRVTTRGTSVEVGYFDAPISEYKPANASSWSPWSKQESAMMQGAVERQAIAQATPLGGLHAQGEDESANTAQTVLGAGQGSGEGPGWGDMPLERVRAVMNVIERAKDLGHAGLSAVETIQQRLNGQTIEVVAMWIESSTATLDEMEARAARLAEDAIPDADVVAPADEFTLSFGGETFTFGFNDDAYGMIGQALADGPDAMKDVAISLGVAGAKMRADAPNFDDLGMLADAERYANMAAALHREAQERDGQTEMDV